MKVVSYTAVWHDRLLAFRRRLYPDNAWGHTAAHFRWRFLENPAGAEPLYLLAVEGDTILGQWAGLHDRLWSGGRAWPCAWMVDLVVAPEHRDTMAAAALFRSAMRAGPPLLAIGAAEHMLDFYRALRWDRLAVTDTFYSVFRPGPLLRLSGLESSGWRTAVLRAADAVLPWAHRMHRGDTGVQPLAGFTEEVDALFNRLRDRLGVTPERSAASLTWKFDRRPCGRHLALAARGAGGDLRGLLVIKFRHRAGVARWAEIADVITPPDEPDVFEALVARARAEARSAGADFVRLRCSLSEHTTLLRRPWWVRRVRSPVDDLFVYARDPAARAALLARPWHYTAICSDAVDTGSDEWETRRQSLSLSFSR